MSERLELPGLQSLIGWIALALVLLSALALGANRPVAWTLLSMAVLVLFLVQILLDAVTGLSKPAIQLWPLSLIYIAVLAWGLVQTIPGLLPAYAHPFWQLVPDAPATISADPIAGRHIVMRLTCYAMIFWIFVRAAEDSSNAIRYLKAIAIFTGALAVYGLWAGFSGQNPILNQDSSVVSASFVNRNSYATYAVFSALVNLAVYMHLTEGHRSRDDARKRGLRQFLESFFGGAWIFGLGFLLCLAALFLSQSRAGAAAGVLALATFFAFYARRKAGLNPLVFILPVGLIVFSVFVLTTDVTKRLLADNQENLRFVIYPYVIDGIEAQFLVGHGLGAFEDTFRARVPLAAAEAEWDKAHSTYLENLYELGVPAGGALFICLFLMTIVIARGAIIRRRNRIFPCMALACVAGAGFHSFLDFSLEIPAVAALFAVIAGIGWTQSFRRDYVEPR